MGRHYMAQAVWICCLTPLIAFHVSGGTTEAVLVRPDKERIFTAEIVSCSLDLKGGQAVDRVGVMLGLSFPAGKELEQLALQWKQPCKVKASVKGQDFLSVRH